MRLTQIASWTAFLFWSQIESLGISFSMQDQLMQQLNFIRLRLDTNCLPCRLSDLHTDRRKKRIQAPASTEKATHVDIQNKLSEMLSSSSDEDESPKDTFEDTPVDNLQPAASIGRAAYEVFSKLASSFRLIGLDAFNSPSPAIETEE